MILNGVIIAGLVRIDIRRHVKCVVATAEPWPWSSCGAAVGSATAAGRSLTNASKKIFAGRHAFVIERGKGFRVMTTLPKHPVSATVGWALLQAARLHRARLEEKLARWGLFAGQEQVIQVLASTDLITMAELAAVVRVRPPTVSKTVARLVSQGLVERQSEPEDGRLVRVRLTDRGKRLSAEIECVWKDVEAELLGPLDAKERKRLRKALRRIAKNLATLVGGNAEGLDEDLDDPPEATGLCA